MIDIDRSERPHECCRNPDGLTVVQASATLFIETCRTCGCRHFVAVLDPLPLGVEIKE